MGAGAIISLVVTYGPIVVGALMAAITAIKATTAPDPACTLGAHWCMIVAYIEAALWAILGFVVKPKNMTGGTVPNPTSAQGTLPPNPLTVNTPLVSPANPDVKLPPPLK